MDKIEFTTAISELTTVFGEKNYSRSRIDRLWTKINHIEYSKLKFAVNEAIVKNKDINWFEFIDSNREKEEVHGNIVPINGCKICGGYGSMIVNHDGTRWAYRCMCSAGMNWLNFPVLPQYLETH